MAGTVTNPETVPQPYSDITHVPPADGAAPGGSGAGAQPGVVAMEPSRIADVQPTVYEEPVGQQAATAPGSGSEETTNQVPFKEQVNGYAKKFAGKVFHNEREVEFGEAKLEGRA